MLTAFFPHVYASTCKSKKSIRHLKLVHGVVYFSGCRYDVYVFIALCVAIGTGLW